MRKRLRFGPGGEHPVCAAHVDRPVSLDLRGRGAFSDLFYPLVPRPPSPRCDERREVALGPYRTCPSWEEALMALQYSSTASQATERAPRSGPAAGFVAIVFHVRSRLRPPPPLDSDGPRPPTAGIAVTVRTGVVHPPTGAVAVLLSTGGCTRRLRAVRPVPRVHGALSLFCPP